MNFQSGPSGYNVGHSISEFPEEQARAEEEISGRLPREVLSLNKRLDKQQESIDKLQSDMTNLMAMVSQISSSLGQQPERAPMPTEPPPTSTAFSTPQHYQPNLSPVPEGSTPADSSSTAPASSSARSLHFGGSTNLSERNIEERLQPYGLHNLTHRSVFRADGTKHSFYALPENYPLERATLGPVFDACVDEMDGCSIEFVAVLADIPKQQIHEEAQQESGQLLTCTSKATGTEQTSAYLNYISDVFDFTLELQQQEHERACNCPLLKASDSLVTISSRLSIDHSMSELRLLWDPGILNQMDIMPEETAVPKLLQSGQTTFKWLIFVGQPIDLKQLWAQLLLPSHSWYNTPNAFLQVHYRCLPFVLDCPYSEPVQLLVCYSRVFSLTETILSAMRMSTATTVRMVLVLSSGEIAQEGRDAAAVYHVFKIQLPISKTSHIWDPGIESIMFLYKGLHVHMIQLAKCFAIHGVHENYTANHLLLSSQRYLQIWENDIIFITFRPP